MVVDTYHAAPINMSRNAFFSSLSEDVDVEVKTNGNVVYRGLYSRQRVRVITLFQTFFRIVFAC